MPVNTARHKFIHGAKTEIFSGIPFYHFQQSKKSHGFKQNQRRTFPGYLIKLGVQAVLEQCHCPESKPLFVHAADYTILKLIKLFTIDKTSMKLMKLFTCSSGLSLWAVTSPTGARPECLAIWPNPIWRRLARNHGNFSRSCKMIRGFSASTRTKKENILGSMRIKESTFSGNEVDLP